MWYTVSMKESGLIIHVDGGARGNPGPAACAFIAEGEEKIVQKGSKFLGDSTNNCAEYQGVILALQWLEQSCKNFSWRSATFFLDSELAVRQLSGVYKVKDKKLIELYQTAIDLIKRIGLTIKFERIPRENNKIADFLVNKELDQKH